MIKNSIIRVGLILTGLMCVFALGKFSATDINTGQIINEDTETEIVYVDREIIVTVPVIEYVDRILIETDTEVEIVYVEIPGDSDVTLTAMATHQDYVDWFEEYEELIDDFIDQLYREHNSAFGLAEDYNRYLQAKLNNGELLDATQVEFMFEYQELRLEWADFHEWIDEEIEPIYEELMDEFPQEETEE